MRLRSDKAAPTAALAAAAAVYVPAASATRAADETGTDRPTGRPADHDGVDADRRCECPRGRDWTNGERRGTGRRPSRIQRPAPHTSVYRKSINTAQSGRQQQQQQLQRRERRAAAAAGGTANGRRRHAVIRASNAAPARPLAGPSMHRSPDNRRPRPN